MKIEVTGMSDEARTLCNEYEIPFREDESGVTLELPEGTVVKNDVEDAFSRAAEYRYHFGSSRPLIVNAHTGVMSAAADAVYSSRWSGRS